MNKITCLAVWADHAQSEDEIAEALLETLLRIEASSPKAIVWHNAGDESPLVLTAAAVKVLVADGVWRDAMTGEANADNGYSLSVVGWRMDTPPGTWESVVSLYANVGHWNSPQGVWPNRLSIEVSDYPDLFSLGVDAMKAAIEVWPVAWGKLFTAEFRRHLDAPVMPATSLGLVTWVSSTLASVPDVVPNAEVSDLAGGRLIHLIGAEKSIPERESAREVERFMRTAGSLPDMPTRL